VGTDLKAPSAARGRVSTPGHALVAVVRPGDVVVHYDRRDEEVVGFSVVTGDAEPAPTHWVARGTYARRAGEQLRARAPGQALYFPWSPYRDTLRTYQSYLAKARRQRSASATGVAASICPVKQMIFGDEILAACSGLIAATG